MHLVHLFMAAVLVLLASGLASLLAGRGRAANLIGPAGAVLGSVLGLGVAAAGLMGGAAGPDELSMAWAMPLGTFIIGLDGLSLVFLLPVFLLAAVTAVHGRAALAHEAGARPLGAHWLFFNLTVAALAMAIAAKGALLFLMCWEVMSVTPFFLIAFKDEEENVRTAAWVYLIAAHVGGAFLLGMFALLASRCGGLDFASFLACPADLKDTVFLLALVGFGAKAGLMPLHVWLPEAHPAAPSHVSAFLSGALIKAGIYGILRTLTFLGSPHAWWPHALIGLGLVTALLGILMALSQRNVKRLLAYSSVENIGLMTLAMGLGLLGATRHQPVVAALGFGGALLHVLNHSLFKGLLFLCAGNALHATGTVVMEHLGGLMRRMPVTGLAFAVGSVAICGLPPLNGFAGEFLMYMAAGTAGLQADGTTALAGWGSVAGLAFVGGMAALGLSKAFGIAFLGEPRSEEAARAHEASGGEKTAVAVLALACVLAGVFAPWLLNMVLPAVAQLPGVTPPASPAHPSAALASATDLLSNMTLASLPLFIAVAGLALLRGRLLAGRSVRRGETWGCGYLAPTARIQYTGSSFSEPMTTIMRPALAARSVLDAPAGLFPAHASLRTTTPDWMRERLFEPVMEAVCWLADHLKWLQHGNVNLYILYIAVTLIGVLAWRLG